MDKVNDLQKTERMGFWLKETNLDNRSSNDLRNITNENKQQQFEWIITHQRSKGFVWDSETSTLVL